jgi:hypothetical protein
MRGRIRTLARATPARHYRGHRATLRSADQTGRPADVPPEGGEARLREPNLAVGFAIRGLDCQLPI